MRELFEHTADLGLRVRAAELNDLFREAAEGLFAILVEPEPHGEPAGSRRFAIDGTRYDFLLFDWLGELLYVHETERTVLGGFDVRVAGPGLRATASEFPLAGGGFRVLREVKAITYHGLKAERSDGGWLAEVIVDI